MTNDERAVEHLKKLDRIVEKYGASQYLRDYIDKEFIDADGNAVVEINLYDGINMFDKLSRRDQSDLNEEIYEYIDRKVKIIPPHIPIKLVFFGSNLNDEEKGRVRQLIKEHYSIELFNQQKNRRILRKKTNRLVAIGIIIFILVFYLESIEGYKVLTDFLSIVGTFSLWEVANTLILARKDVKYDTLHKAKMLAVDVEFFD